MRSRAADWNKNVNGAGGCVIRAGKLANLIALELALACVLSAAGAAAAARFGHFGGGGLRFPAPSHSASLPRFPSTPSTFPRYPSSAPRQDARYGSPVPRPDARDGGWRDHGWADRRAREGREQARADAGRWHDSREHTRPDAANWHAAPAPAAAPPVVAVPVMSQGGMMMSPGSSSLAGGLASLAVNLLEDLFSSYSGARSYDEMSAQESMDRYPDDYYGAAPDTGGPIMGQDYRY